MFIVEGQHTDAEIRDQPEIDAVIRHLGHTGYRPVLRSMVRTASEVAALPAETLRVDPIMRMHGGFRRPDVPPVPPGDLLFKGDHAYIVQPMGRRLHAWEVRPHSVPSALADFGSQVERAARASLDGRRLRGMDFSWKPIKERAPSRRFPARRFYQEAKLETRPAEYSEAEAAGARLLVGAESRSLLLRLAQVGKARSIDTAAEASASFTGPLLDAGLVKREYLLLCRQDSHTICAFQERSELEAGIGLTFVCSICGRAFKDELAQEIFALTDHGRRLLNGSRWMTIWVTELLVSSGIAREQIAWNAVAGEDELDIMTDALGPRVFFELKDREFGLGDAYPFAFRVTRYGGSFGIVVTTDRVADEAKRFFQEQRPAMDTRIESLEGQPGIQEGIPSLVDRVSRSGVNQLLLELTESLGLNLVPILQAWMDQKGAARATSNSALQPPPGAAAPSQDVQA
jgi:hypothetical protein